MIAHPDLLIDLIPQTTINDLDILLRFSKAFTSIIALSFFGMIYGSDNTWLMVHGHNRATLP
jgi:hypothetical protein